MICKTFELRDRSTFVPVIAIKLQPTNEADRYLLARSGYGQTPEKQSAYVLMGGLNGGEDKLVCDPNHWGGNRTRVICHAYISENFDGLESGDVIDAEFIVGLSLKPKISERLTNPHED